MWAEATFDTVGPGRAKHSPLLDFHISRDTRRLCGADEGGGGAQSMDQVCIGKSSSRAGEGHPARDGSGRDVTPPSLVPPLLEWTEGSNNVMKN